jgi:hypothetical protein
MLKNLLSKFARSSVLAELRTMGDLKPTHRQPITHQGKLLVLFRPKGFWILGPRLALSALQSFDGVEGGKVLHSGDLLIRVRPALMGKEVAEAV